MFEEGITMFFKKKSKSVDNNIYRFVKGERVPLESVSDQVFAQKMMGDGVAIQPEDANIYAPCSGIVSVVFPTGHAYGITRDDDVEILIHLGINTVELNGEGFETKVSQGDTVKRGDLLGTADWDLIESKDRETVSMIIVTSGESIVIKDDSDILFEVNK